MYDKESIEFERVKDGLDKSHSGRVFPSKIDELTEDELVDEEEDEDDVELSLLEDDVVEEDGTPLEEDGEEDEGEDNKTFPVKSTKNRKHRRDDLGLVFFKTPPKNESFLFLFFFFSFSEGLFFFHIW